MHLDWALVPLTRQHCCTGCIARLYHTHGGTCVTSLTQLKLNACCSGAVGVEGQLIKGEAGQTCMWLLAGNEPDLAQVKVLSAAHTANNASSAGVVGCLACKHCRPNCNNPASCPLCCCCGHPLPKWEMPGACTSSARLSPAGWGAYLPYALRGSCSSSSRFICNAGTDMCVALAGRWELRWWSLPCTSNAVHC